MIDQTVLTQLQYDLIEPQIDGGASWDSGLWTREEVLGAITFRQSTLLKQTLLVVSRDTTTLVPGQGTLRMDLPADWIRTVSLVWTGADGTIRELSRGSAFEADHLLPTWASVQAPPLVYMEYDTPTLQVEIGPIPDQAGTCELLYIARGDSLTGDGVALVVPDEVADAVIFGALAELLSKDGRGQDLGRSAYAEQRFDFTVELTRLLLGGFA